MTHDLENVELTLEMKCPRCQGLGAPDGDLRYPCRNCAGRGYVPTDFGNKVIELVRHNFKSLLQDSLRE